MAEKDRVINFVEVKYRRQEAQGDGFEYITRQKLHRMNFAAEVYSQTFGWTGDYRLIAAAVTGEDSDSIELTEIA